MSAPQNRTGILLLILGIAVFSVQDLILKWFSTDYPLSEAMVIRSLVALPLHLAIVRGLDGHMGTILAPGWPAMLARGFLNFSAYTAYYLALAALPMATTVALYFTAPIMITLMAAALLHEKIPASRWLAVLAGFAGVLVMVRPGSAIFDWAAVLALVSGAAYAASMVLARVLGRAQSAAALAFWSNIAFLISALILAAVFGTGRFQGALHPSVAFLTRGWLTPTPQAFFALAGCGVIAAVGLTLLTQAYRIGQSAAVAPFEYTFVFWGLLWGWLIWGDLPDGAGWAGIAVIVLAGLYLLRRETAPAPPGAGLPPVPGNSAENARGDQPI